jgi:hypothetical protein
MTNQIITIHNAETNEVIEREMTTEEIAWLESANAPYQPTEEEIAKAAAKAALLDKLGITAEEAVLLLGGTN